MDARFPNLRHLRAFLEVSRSHSISIAADLVHLSQPAVTQAISKLESGLNASLFQRGNLGFYTTEIGAKFAWRVERALGLLRQGAKLSYRTDKKGGNRGFTNFDELATSAQLRALVAVGQSLSYSVAGRDIGLSQPTIHRSVSNLESLSGLKLFSRITSGIEPTSAGRILIKHTKLAYAELQQGMNEISEHKGRNTTVITVGSLPLARTYILPKVIHAMVESSEDVQVHIIDGPYNELLRGLRNGDIDCLIGALRDPAPAEDVVQEALFSDPLTIVAGRHHPLAKGGNMSIKDTLAYPWAAPPKTTPSGAYLFETLQIEHLLRTPVRVVSSSLVFLRELLAQGDYLTIISQHQIKEEIRHGSLVPLPILLANNERPIGVTLRRDWKATLTQSRFLDFLRCVCEDL